MRDQRRLPGVLTSQSLDRDDPSKSEVNDLRYPEDRFRDGWSYWSRAAQQLLRERDCARAEVANLGRENERLEAALGVMSTTAELFRKQRDAHAETLCHAEPTP